jgi:hypothetical protein
MKCGAALVRADAAHEVDARHVTVLIAFVDPESELGAALSERIKGNILRLSTSEVFTLAYLAWGPRRIPRGACRTVGKK